MRASSIILAVLTVFAATPSLAEPVTFVLEYSRFSGPSGSATAVMVLDDALLINNGVAGPVTRSTDSGFPELTSFELTISDTGFIDGTYTLDDLTVFLHFHAPLDPTIELLAQDTAIGPGGDFELNVQDDELLQMTNISTFGAVIRDVMGVILEQATFRLSSITPVPAVSDQDGDGIADDADNCSEIVNAEQIDADADGIGNACDPDFNQDCLINVEDLGLLKASFFSTDPNTDLSGDGQTNFVDLGILKALFFGAPGPSGLANDCN